MKYFYFSILLVVLNCKIFAQVTLVTNMPPAVAPNVNLKIEVKINKGAIGNFSKYEMDLPQGFEASEGNSKTGYFTFEKNKAKIVWVTLPTEAEFIVSFKLKTPSAVGPYVLNHRFFYIDNGIKKQIDGQQIDVKVDASGVTKTLSYLPDEPENPVVTNTVAASQPTITAVTTPTVSSVTAATLTPVQTNTVATTTPTLAAAGNTIATTINNVNTSQAGIIYLVQIGTFGTDPGKTKYSDLGKVTVEKTGAVYKVLIGDFNTKEEAFKKRDELTTKGYNGFVVTYQNGQRVK